MNKISIEDRTIAKDLEKQWNAIVWLADYGRLSVSLPIMPTSDIPDEFFNLSLVQA